MFTNRPHLFVYSRGGRLLQICALIGQEARLSSSCPIRMSDQTNNIALIGWYYTMFTNRPPLWTGSSITFFDGRRLLGTKFKTFSREVWSNHDSGSRSLLAKEPLFPLSPRVEGTSQGGSVSTHPGEIGHYLNNVLICRYTCDEV